MLCGEENLLLKNNHKEISNIVSKYFIIYKEILPVIYHLMHSDKQFMYIKFYEMHTKLDTYARYGVNICNIKLHAWELVLWITTAKFSTTNI